ncbi:hypothetical protein ACFFX0_05225 [Citricoccus parietis]|uniref:Uncharacterized protein n=1 Tax=Citricoccus parietis TaxID=592307 RepID=A0ABV5FVZ2_9MICC
MPPPGPRRPAGPPSWWCPISATSNGCAVPWTGGWARRVMPA